MSAGEGVARRFFLKSLVSAAFVAGFAPKVSFLGESIPDPLNEISVLPAAPKFFANDVILNTRTREVMLVTAVKDTALTVVRGIGTQIAGPPDTTIQVSDELQYMFPAQEFYRPTANPLVTLDKRRKPSR